MTDYTRRSAEWVYKGVWGILAEWFKVPEEPPALPAAPGDFYRSFHPARGYLQYRKLLFWFIAGGIDFLLVTLWLSTLFISPIVTAIAFLPMLAVTILPDIIPYVAVHLRYDTMWYVMTDRSLRIRRGIWDIMEHTITFENVQNVSVSQGPLQRYFGIATIVVETAGASSGEGESVHAIGNKAIMEGIENPEEIRDLIMERVRRSRTAGLGDDGPGASTHAWTPAQRQLLREIRDSIVSQARMK